MKSTRSWNLIIDQGMMSVLRVLSSINHLKTRLLASRLWRMLPSRKEEMTLTWYA